MSDLGNVYARVAIFEQMHQILLIEDNSSDILLIQEGIRRARVSAELTIAADGEQALNLLGSQQFDLVILDLNIPKFTGHFILDQHRLRSGPPVIVFTSSQSATDREIALAFGAKDYVVKPLDFLQFMDAVRGMLQRSNAACV